MDHGESPCTCGGSHSLSISTLLQSSYCIPILNLDDLISISPNIRFTSQEHSQSRTSSISYFLNLVLPHNLPIFSSMPLYEIHHSVALLSAQLSALAIAITDLHCNTFSAPSSFVNVVFYPATTSETTIGPAVYVGGKKVSIPTPIQLQQAPHCSHHFIATSTLQQNH
jgi:phenylpyruvate tautomerase PptA (4-oxalocrotonate tautomerase family)